MSSHRSTGLLVILSLHAIVPLRAADTLGQNVTYAALPMPPAQADALMIALSNQVAAAENLIGTSNYDVIVAPQTNAIPLPVLYFDPAYGLIAAVEDACSNYCTLYYTNGQRLAWPIYEPRVVVDANGNQSLDTNDVEVFGFLRNGDGPFVQTNRVTVTIGGISWKCETNPVDNWFGIGVDNQDGTCGVKESTSLPVIGNRVVVLGATNNLIVITQTPLNHE